jgi:hypothetical protein
MKMKEKLAEEYLKSLSIKNYSGAEELCYLAGFDKAADIITSHFIETARRLTEERATMEDPIKRATHKGAIETLLTYADLGLSIGNQEFGGAE